MTERRWPDGPASWEQERDEAQPPDDDEGGTFDHPNYVGEEAGAPPEPPRGERSRNLPVERVDRHPTTAPSRLPAIPPENPRLAEYATGMYGLRATRIHTVEHVEDTKGGTETAQAYADTLKAVEGSLRHGGGVVAGIICRDGELYCYVAGPLAGTPSGDDETQVTPDWPPTARGERVDPAEIVNKEQEFPYWAATTIEQDTVGQRTGRELGRSVAEVLNTNQGNWAVRITAKQETIPNRIAYDRLKRELTGIHMAATGLNGQPTTPAVMPKTQEERDALQEQVDATKADIARLEAEMASLKQEGLGKSRTEVRAVLHAGAEDPVALQRVLRGWDRSAPPHLTLSHSTLPPTANPRDIGASISVEDLLKLVRLPERPMPGLTHKKVPHTSPVVDPPPPGMPEGHLGDIIVGNKREGRFGLNDQDYALGVWIVGERGSGKSTTLRNICVDAAEQGKRLIVCDPPGRLRSVIPKLPSDRAVLELRPGDPTKPQPVFNPFRAVEGSDDARQTMELAYAFAMNMFHDSGSRGSSFPGNIRTTIKNIYEKAGWHESGKPIPDMQQRWPTLHDFHAELLRVIGRVDADNPGTASSNKDASNYIAWADARVREVLKSPLGKVLVDGEGQELGESALDDPHIFISGSGMPAWALRIYHQVVVDKASERARIKRIQAGHEDGLSDTITTVHVIDEVNLTLSNKTSGPEAGLTEAWLKWLEVCRNYGDGVVIGAISFQDAPEELQRMLSTVIIGRVKGSTRVTAAGLTNASPGLHDHFPYQKNGEVVVFNYRTTYGPIRLAVVEQKPDNPDANVLATANLVKSGSSACGPSCGVLCCTGSEMDEATVFSEGGKRGRELTALAQFAAICTLTRLEGDKPESLPLTPSPEFVKYLKSMPTRAAECAIRAAVNKAVNDRRDLLARHNISEARLKGYLGAQLRAELLGQQAVTAAGVEFVLAPYQPTPPTSPEDTESPEEPPIRTQSPLRVPDQQALFLGDPMPPLIAREQPAALVQAWGGVWSATDRMRELADTYLDYGASRAVAAQYETYVATYQKAHKKSEKTE